MENYFEFYGMKPRLMLDEAALHQHFLSLSKEHHPDFFVNDEDRHGEALEKTSLNNKAFNELRTLDGRVRHLLELEGILEEAGNKIPQEFLSEMMDFNESVMDLQMNFDPLAFQELKTKYGVLCSDLETSLINASKLYDAKASEEGLQAVKEIYLKRKYVLRLEEALHLLEAQL